MKILSTVISGILAFTGLVTATTCRLVSLSGGGSHGAFEAGVLSNIIESPTWNPWDVHLGVSAGSLGVLGLMKNDYTENTAIMKSVWGVTKTYDVIQPRLFENSLSGNDKVKKLILGTYASLKGSPAGGKFVVGVTNLVTGGFEARELDPFDPFFNYVLASTSIPVVFPPVGELVDGGLQKNEMFLSGLEYCPPGSLSYEMDLIFANLEVPDNVQPPKTILEITARSLDIIRRDFNNLYYKTVLSCQGAVSRGLNLTVTIHNPPSPIPVGTLDFDKGDMLWRLGYYNSTKLLIKC